MTETGIGFVLDAIGMTEEEWKSEGLKLLEEIPQHADLKGFMLSLEKKLSDESLVRKLAVVFIISSIITASSMTADQTNKSQ